MPNVKRILFHVNNNNEKEDKPVTEKIYFIYNINVTEPEKDCFYIYLINLKNKSIGKECGSWDFPISLASHFRPSGN